MGGARSVGSVTAMGKTLRTFFTRPPRFDREWMRVIKRTVARYARGNIAAQNGRILMPKEQEQEREQALKIYEKWKERYEKAKFRLR